MKKKIGASQRWLLCESPRHLIQVMVATNTAKALESICRVVLGPELIEADGKTRVFHAAELLQDFLRTFQNESRTATKLSQPVLLIMIFGHGDPVAYGVAIGRTRKSD